MNTENNANTPLNAAILVEVIARLSVVAILAYFCLKVVTPFMPLMLWGLILAIMFFPLHQKLAGMLGGKQGRASTIMVLIGCALLLVPLFMLAESAIVHTQDVAAKLENDTLQLNPPSAKVADWPIIGERVYTLWNEAAQNSSQFISDYKEQIQELSKKGLAMAKGAFGSVGVFIGSMIVAGIMMAWAESGTNAMKRIFSRFSGDANGPALLTLSVATMRSVGSGVLGVAFIQAMLFGIGFIAAGIPAAGLLALIVLFIGIVQMPALIISLPVIALMWSGDGSTLYNVGFTIYFIVAGFSDGVLKPLLLGRGVDAPMPVILIGALGGMVVSGFIGLFLGATFLTLGYKVFMGWVDREWSPDFD